MSIEAVHVTKYCVEAQLMTEHFEHAVAPCAAATVPEPQTAQEDEPGD